MLHFFIHAETLAYQIGNCSVRIEQRRGSIGKPAEWFHLFPANGDNTTIFREIRLRIES